LPGRIGQRAITLAVEHLKSVDGLTRVTLNVRTSNIRAITCYERCGFKITRTSERQQGEGSTFMYHTMILNLSQPIGPPAFLTALSFRRKLHTSEHTEVFNVPRA
jgi:ribosomal protein S18 acetylase RimI-like enzyme